MNKGIVGLVFAGAMAVSSVAAAGSLNVFKFAATQDATTASSMVVCRYSSGVAMSDDGDESYAMEVSALTSTEKSRLQTAIANRTAALNIKVLEQLNVISNGYVSLAYDYEIRFVRGTSVTIIASDSVSDDSTSGTQSNNVSISANLALAGVPSTLNSTDRFEVVFHGSVDNVCGNAFSQVGSATYLSNVYGTAKVTLTGTY